MDSVKYEYDYLIIVTSDGGKVLTDKLKEGWKIVANTCGTHCVHYVISREIV